MRRKSQWNSINDDEVVETTAQKIMKHEDMKPIVRITITICFLLEKYKLSQFGLDSRERANLCQRVDIFVHCSRNDQANRDLRLELNRGWLVVS